MVFVTQFPSYPFSHIIYYNMFHMFQNQKSNVHEVLYHAPNFHHTHYYDCTHSKNKSQHCVVYVYT